MKIDRYLMKERRERPEQFRAAVETYRRAAIDSYLDTSPDWLAVTTKSSLMVTNSMTEWYEKHKNVRGIIGNVGAIFGLLGMSFAHLPRLSYNSLVGYQSGGKTIRQAELVRQSPNRQC